MQTFYLKCKISFFESSKDSRYIEQKFVPSAEKMSVNAILLLKKGAKKKIALRMLTKNW